jgi:hypothetical protein
MKKNLRNILTLALGFVTIFATAQSWDADSRTRVDMGGENDQFTTDQRISLGASWGGNGWGINVSGNANYDLGGDAIELDWNEAYATTDLMGWASVAVGRQALEYGGGRLIGANDWAANPNTRDGGVFTINNDMLDLDFGMYKNNPGITGDSDEGTSDYFVNASKSDGDWSVNLTYISNTDETNAMGLDFGYSMMGGDVDLGLSYNTSGDGDEATEDGSMMSLAATYNMNDNMSISATRTTSGDGAFGWGGSNYGDGAASWDSHGNMGNLGANDEDLAFAVSYTMGDFGIGIGMHKVTNTEADDYERNVTEANFSYTMSDNANVGIKYATDNNGGDDDVKYMWLTLSVSP